MHLETAKRDLTYITDRTVPEWVNGAVSRMPIFPHTHTRPLFTICWFFAAQIYGTVIIFWSFAVVQIIYERTPAHYSNLIPALRCT